MKTKNDIGKLAHAIGYIDYLQNEGVIYTHDDVTALKQLLGQLKLIVSTIERFNVR